MKKIKILKILFWIFFVLVIIYILAQILLFIMGYWELVLIKNACIITFFMYLLIANSPQRSLHRFYDDRHVKKLRKLLNKLEFKGPPKQIKEFSCGPTVMQMTLENHGIMMSQEEIMRFVGDKDFGTSHWEIKNALNMIFGIYGKPFRARISYYTTCAELEQQVADERGVIVLFMSRFQQGGFTSRATYPHFAVLSFISVSSSQVVLIAPSSHHVSHGESEEGELMLTKSDFHHRFYAHTKHLKRLEYKPTLYNPYTKRRNQFWNFLSRLVMIFAYYTKILKPGIAIIIEPVQES